MSPSNPLYNKPLPVLSNLNAMNDMDIYQALQRLFVEQQKILATGKVISTLPAGPNYSTNVPISTAPIITNQATVSPVKKTIIDTKPTAPAIVSNASSLPNSKIKTNYSVRQTQNLQPVCIVSPQQQLKPSVTLSKCDVTSSTATSSPIVSPVVVTLKESAKPMSSPKLAEAIPKVQTSTSSATSCVPPEPIPMQPVQPTPVPRTCL